VVRGAIKLFLIKSPFEGGFRGMLFQWLTNSLRLLERVKDFLKLMILLKR
jgi:hypothetical protein